MPKDEAWRQVTLTHIAGLGQRLWIHCTACWHERFEEPLGFGAAHRLTGSTPLLAISLRLVCSRCGARKAHCNPEPYSIGRTPRAG